MTKHAAKSSATVDPVQRMRAARLSLPAFYRVIASEMQLVEGRSEQLSELCHQLGVETVGVTPRGALIFEPEFVRTLPDDALLTLWAHEGLHLVLQFWRRFAFALDQRATALRANEAHDHAINLMLKAAGYAAIEGWFCDPQWQDLSAEQIYERLGDPPPDPSSAPNAAPAGADLVSVDAGAGALHRDVLVDARTLDECAFGAIPDVAPVFDNARLPPAVEPIPETRWRDVLRRAVAADRLEEGGRSVGAMPRQLQLQVRGILDADVDMETALRRLWGHWGRRVRPSFKRRHRRNANLEGQMWYPGRRQSEPPIYILLDSSASMVVQQDLVREVLGVLRSLLRDRHDGITLVQADAAVSRVVSGEDLASMTRDQALTLVGLGGSDFRPAFEWIWRKTAAQGHLGCAVIAVTDGLMRVPERVPNALRCEVLWLTPENAPLPARWGSRAVVRRRVA